MFKFGLGLKEYLPSERHEKKVDGSVERVVDFTEKDLKDAKANYQEAENENDQVKMRSVAMKILEIKDFLLKKNKNK